MADNLQKTESVKCDVCGNKPSCQITLGTVVGTELNNPHGFSIYLCSDCIQAAAAKLGIK